MLQVNRGNEALKSFVKKLDEVEVWVETVVVNFLRSQGSMGQDYSNSISFLESHKDLTNKIHMKTFELEGLRGALKTISDQCSNDETKEVEQKMDLCNNKLQVQMKKISHRLGAGEKLVKFQKLLEQIDREIQALDRQLNSNKPGLVMMDSNFEESILLIQQLALQASNLGRNTSEDILAITGDDYLDKNSAVAFIQDCLRQLEQKQVTIGEKRKSMEARAQQGKMVEEEWTRINREKRESMSFSLKIDSELFPVILADSRPEQVVSNLEERTLNLPKQRMISERIVQLISTVEDMLPRLPEERKVEAKGMIEDLRQKLNTLQVQAFSSLIFL